MIQKLFKHILLADDDIDDCEFFTEFFSALSRFKTFHFI